MLGRLFGQRKKQKKQIEHVDVSDYEQKQNFLLKHLEENIEKLESTLLTTNIRYGSDIHHESARMQLVAINFIAEQVGDISKHSVLIGHDLEELQKLAKAVKDKHLHADDVELEVIGIQHAIQHHCEEIKNLQEENSVLMRKVIEKFKRWQFKKEITKTEQSDIKTDLVTIRDELNYAIDNMHTVSRYMDNITKLIADFEKEQEQIKAYAFHAMHTDFKIQLSDLNEHKIGHQDLERVDNFLREAQAKLDHMQEIARIQDIDEQTKGNIQGQIKKINEFLVMLKEVRNRVTKKLSSEHRIQMQTHLQSLQDLYEDFDTKVKLLNK